MVERTTHTRSGALPKRAPIALQRRLIVPLRRTAVLVCFILALLSGCGSDVRTSPASEPGFDLTLTFQEGGDGPTWTDAQRRAVRDAAARWSQHVHRDLPALWVEKGPGECVQSPAEPAFEGVLDDVHVFVLLAPLDGPGGMLARAGPCGTRRGGPSMFGVVRFDVDDLSRIEGEGALTTVALHELGHVLGIGAGRTWWASDLRPQGAGCRGAEAPTFSGPSTMGAWAAAGRAGPVPLEADGGAATACAHWDGEAAYGELMIGWLSGAMRLTGVSLGALEDLGYGVEMGGVASLGTLHPSHASAPLGRDEVLRSEAVVGSDGFRARPLDFLREGVRERDEDGRRRASLAAAAAGPSLEPCETPRVSCSSPFP